jgi:Holliday junction resolvase
MSREKGKRGERECAALLREFGFTARRGQQFAGGGDSPDVLHSMEGFHVEVKNVEAFALYPALDQANAEKKPAEDAIVFHKRNNKPWIVVLDARIFLKLMKDYVYDQSIR